MGTMIKADSMQQDSVAVRTELHAHSTCSDGNVDPERLVELALGEQIGLLALTDHDTMAGIERARAAAEGSGLTVLPAVELSTHWRGSSVHLLGYFAPGWGRRTAESERMREWLQALRRHREMRNRQLAAKLRAHGLPLELEKLAQTLVPRMTVDQIGRPHIAQWMVEKGHALSIADAFARYLTPGAATYVQLDGVPTVEAVRTVREMGGYPCLAHPVRLKVELESILPELVREGLFGLEVYYPKHSVEQAARYRKAGEKYGLALTGGSDFHGRAGERLGSVQVPEEAVGGWSFARQEAPAAVLRQS